MKIIHILLFLFFLTAILPAQTDEHVLLNLGLDSAFSEIHDNDPGASIFIQKDNQIMYSKSFGLANLKTKEKFNENTNVNIASITKTFIAYGILILQKQGKLSIEDSISRFFSHDLSKEAGVVKIKHLLTHTAGLPDVQGDEKEILKKIDKPEFEPGSNYKYSEVSYKIMTMIIEKVTNDKWHMFIQKNIFEPAGMIHTKIPEFYVEEKIALSYKKSKQKYKLVKYKKRNLDKNELLNVWISVGELRKYIYAINECVFLDCELLKQISTLWTPDNWRSSLKPIHGFAWFISESKEKDTKISYDGIYNGYRSTVITYPKEKIIVIAVSNNSVSYSENIVKRLTELKYVK
ncbi:MAG: beta-lactamase family protein [Bacteroidia bacterium]|nr:beta-lactamase family protein [Bacteroidia bacterium]